MLTPGLCSVTFRQLDPPALLDLAARAGLAAVEWGADVHVPVGDLATARDVAARTADAGLAVASYGSYWRAGPEDVGPVLATARALGAPRVRVWAGRPARPARATGPPSSVPWPTPSGAPRTSASSSARSRTAGP